VGGWVKAAQYGKVKQTNLVSDLNIAIGERISAEHPCLDVVIFDHLQIFRKHSLRMREEGRQTGDREGAG
jgi:hypothetical protein